MGDPACYAHLLDDEGRMPDLIDLREAVSDDDSAAKPNKDGGENEQRTPEPPTSVKRSRVQKGS